MKQQQFELARGREWDEFEASLDTLSRGYRLNDSTAPAAFADRYLRLCRDLAVAKSRGYSRILVTRLNSLVIRGHNTIYANRSGYLRHALTFLAAGFPREVRAATFYMLISLTLFAGTGAAMGTTVTLTPDWVYTVLPHSEVETIDRMYDPALREPDSGRQSDGDFGMLGYYVMNNVSISFQMFAGGLFAGLGTVFYLVYNGVVLGAITARMVDVGYGETFLPFVIGHGAFELTAIVIAGGAGLMLGHALIAPAPWTRADALRIAGGRAVRIIIGTTIMLFVAAFLEAFWSSSTHIPAQIRYVAGTLLWLLVILYFVAAGRSRGP